MQRKHFLVLYYSGYSYLGIHLFALCDLVKVFSFERKTHSKQDAIARIILQAYSKPSSTLWPSRR
jgi:hypothetical protein